MQNGFGFGGWPSEEDFHLRRPSRRPVIRRQRRDGTQNGAPLSAQAMALWDAEELQRLRSSSGRSSTPCNRRPRKAFVTQLADEEEPFDTDLEEDDEVRPRPQNVKLAMHEELCSRLGVAPISHFVRHANDADFCLRYRGLPKKSARALCGPMTLNTRLHALDLTENYIGHAESTDICATLLFDNPHLTEVNLSCNKLGSQGARQLRTVLRKNQSLRKLNVSDNNFKDKDSDIVAETIIGCEVLEELNLSHNEFSTTGAMTLAKTLASHPTLRSLDLSWNQIRMKGAEAVGQMLATNSTLEKLNLSMNGFAVDGTLHLAAALTQNETLLELDISNNRIPEPICVPFAKLFVRNCTLRVLNMSSNPIGMEGAAAIMTILAEVENLGLDQLIIKDVTVNDKFAALEEEIRSRKPKFETRYGYFSKGKEATKSGSGSKFGDQNPLELLLIFMTEQKLRLVDLFKNLDKDQSMSLTRDEFIDGLKSINTPLSAAQLNELIDMLDKDGDGEVDLSEILNINSEFKDVKAKALKKTKEMEKAALGEAMGTHVGAAVKALSLLNSLKTKSAAS